MSDDKGPDDKGAADKGSDDKGLDNFAAHAALVEAQREHDPNDPDPWLALWLDRTLPFDAEAKAALIRDQRSPSRQFLLPVIRPLARAMIVLAQLIHTVTPRWPHAPRFLHNSIAWGMKYWLTADANRLILRHFHLGAHVLRFISDNATPGYHPKLEAMTPHSVDDVRANLFLKHDLNIYNYLIDLNRELERRGDQIEYKERVDYSAIKEQVDFAPFRNKKSNFIDLQSAIELYTPGYALFLTDRDFWRASNSLQLDEIIGLYCARITGQEQHLALINNRHPLVPHSTLRAGFRLMLHGLSTEVLHGFLVQLKHEQQRADAKAGLQAG